MSIHQCPDCAGTSADPECPTCHPTYDRAYFRKRRPTWPDGEFFANLDRAACCRRSYQWLVADGQRYAPRYQSVSAYGDAPLINNAERCLLAAHEFLSRARAIRLASLGSRHPYRKA